ncbi:phosphatase PAP2 family protein [bacterium]|nr:MAG: phosphatase PAP2 family protein [bacterium]
MRLFATASVLTGLLLPASFAQADVDIPLPPSLSASEMASTTADVPLPKDPKTNDGPAWARFASGKGTALFVASGTLLPLTEGNSNGEQRSLRAADTVLTSAVITQALKKVTHSKRPDGSDYESFPSQHAITAFAIASMQAHFHPDQAIFWYLGATAISASRVKLRRHRVRDVLAGAAIGIATTEIEYRQKRGLLLFPFIHGGGNSRQPQVAGLSFGGSF